ncbi:MAG: BlaI/MecI/CopY family transcriptional regulator [Muribaculaceae bacterium]|nr:BlaI/MecI/CopY family transcriptional regulator [Muribaculaceae bacterium]
MGRNSRKKQALTPREEELMQLLWDNGPMYVRELVQLYPDPKPHVNTVSTVVRTLEEKGYVNHEAAGTGYKYFAVAQKEDFADKTLNNVIKGYFNNSYLNAVSTLVKTEKISVDELRELIDLIEKNNG